MAATARGSAFCLTISSAVLAIGGGAGAAPSKRITGTLTKPGYTVISLAANGKATSARAKKGGRFTLVPPARHVTLHLRARNGTYAGPIVLGSRARGTRAVLGVRAGARLGKIRVLDGHARVARRLPAAAVDAQRQSRSRRGVPIGARVFGRVRSKPPPKAPPGDRDFDGIPGPLDIDDDGDLILDNVDYSRARPSLQNSARVTPHEAGEYSLHSYLETPLGETVNANAANLTTAQVDAALSRNGVLTLSLAAAAELDCGSAQSRADPSLGGLVYCSRGGTGRIVPAGGSPADVAAFPSCCDPDGDGFGALQPPAMNLLHGATTAQIGTADLLIYRVTVDGVETQSLVSVPYVFATVPALVSYDDGQGNSKTLSYPVTGTEATEGYTVGPGPSGDVIVTLKFWRPQRERTPSESGKWIDIGHLDYGVQPSGRNGCPQNTMSENDPDLTESSSESNFGEGAGELTDVADDQPAKDSNTFTYTLNLTECLAARGLTFNSGQVRAFAFGGTSKGDSAFQILSFKRK